ncbi:C2H2 transcription factor [Aspergillus taichungensis]|uniref:C2H2 transcription factor n=1 Tax=Aspergillus taichungensis TaxID=482145 RepID=A0A2J5HR14_9EURO|nr:C2H2 transcription factor [Aspergillus taichungensis]
MMDPRSHPSRPPSTSLPQGSTPLSSTPISSMPMPQYTMQPQYPVSQSHTLPPLQPHHSQSPAPHSYMGQPPYRPDLSRFPTTTHDVYASSTAPIMPHTTVGSLPPASFLSHPNSQAQSSQQHYPPPHSVLPPASSAQTYPQPIAPAPPRDRRPDFSGMPSGAFSYSDGKASPWMNPDPVTGANGASPYGAKESPRTQVVGSQGRRGILPSVPGRATPVTNGVNGTAKSTTIPAKDADGKFPCPHCNKTYLHAKHLKRHLLRHTGDRPYMCVLCKDTFSRSDILKRHFQKCSLRRGNPTGATHLSHPQAHLKRSQAANAAKPIQDEVSSSIPPPSGLPGATFGEGPVNGAGLAPGRPGYADQPPMGFSMSSVNGMSRAHPDDGYNAGRPGGPWLAAPKHNPYLVQPGPDVSGQPLSVDRPSLEQVKPPVMDPKRPVMPGPTPNHSGEIDWTSMFQPGTHDGYMNPVFPHSMAAGHEPIHAPVDADRKYYPTTTAGPQEGGMNGLYLASTMGGDGTIQPARQ